MGDLTKIDEGIKKQREVKEMEMEQKVLNAKNLRRFNNSKPISNRAPFSPGFGSPRYFSEVSPLERGAYKGGNVEVTASIAPDRLRAPDDGRVFETMFTPVDLFDKAFEQLKPTDKLRVCGRVVMDSYNRHEAYWNLDKAINEDMRNYLNSGEYKRMMYERTIQRSKGYSSTETNKNEKNQQKLEKQNHQQSSTSNPVNNKHYDNDNNDKMMSSSHNNFVHLNKHRRRHSSYVNNMSNIIKSKKSNLGEHSDGLDSFDNEHHHLIMNSSDGMNTSSRIKNNLDGFTNNTMFVLDANQRSMRKVLKVISNRNISKHQINNNDKSSKSNTSNTLQLKSEDNNGDAFVKSVTHRMKFVI